MTDGSTTNQHLSVREAAEMLNVHENTVRRWVTVGFLTDASQPGRPLSIPRHQIEAMLTNTTPVGGEINAAYARGHRDGRAAAIREMRAHLSRMRITTTPTDD